MRVLLDTHTFLWMESAPTALSSAAIVLINDPTNELLLSHISLWEIQIKETLGKLTATKALNARVQLAQSKANLSLLPLYLEHIYAVRSLPLHHRDPFDRMLIAQAVHEQLPLISHDSRMSSYPVRLIW